MSRGDVAIRNRQSLMVVTLLLVLQYEFFLRHGYNHVTDHLVP